MPWDEFKDLLTGISPDTPLGRIVSIRAEDDKEVLKHFTQEQLRVRSEWRNSNAKKVTAENMDDFLNSLKKGFISMAKKG